LFCGGVSLYYVSNSVGNIFARRFGWFNRERAVVFPEIPAEEIEAMMDLGRKKGSGRNIMFTPCAFTCTALGFSYITNSISKS
jgi:hypothetical protein